MATHPPLLASRGVVSGITTPPTFLDDVTGPASVIKDMRLNRQDHPWTSDIGSGLLLSVNIPTNKAEPPFSLPQWHTVFLGFLLTVIVLFTSMANITIVAAFALDKGIRLNSNLFVASLAVLDLMLVIVSIPMYTQYSILGFWQWDAWLCFLWLCVDRAACMSSQIMVFTITGDMCLCLKTHERYMQWRTQKTVIQIIMMAWTIPAIFMFTTIMGGQYVDDKMVVLADRKCGVEILEFGKFISAVEMITFWTGFFLMFYMYRGIYKIITSIQEKSALRKCRESNLRSGPVKRVRFSLPPTAKDDSIDSSEYPTSESENTNSHNRSAGTSNPPLFSDGSMNKSDRSTDDTATPLTGKGTPLFYKLVTHDITHASVHLYMDDYATTDSNNNKRNSDSTDTESIDVNEEGSVASASTSGTCIDIPTVPEKRFQKRDSLKKAVKMMSIIFGAFALTWVPFEMCLFLLTTCEDCVNPYVYNATFWLCHLNSFMNPFFYALAKRRLRKRCSQLLRCNWQST